MKSKHYQPWSADEDERLLLLRSRKVPFKDLPKFFEGRSQDAIRGRAWNLRESVTNDWINDEVIGVFDIETTNLKASVGFVLNWAMLVISPEGTETMVGSCIKRSEILNGTTDLRVIKDFIKEIAKVDVLIGYYSTGFDVPYMRSRAEIHGLDFPGYGKLKHIDIYYMVRSKLKLHRSSLGVAAEALGLNAGKKGHVPLKEWNAARIGNMKAINKIYEYCKQDVRITWDLFNRMRKYRKITRKSI